MYPTRSKTIIAIAWILFWTLRPLRPLFGLAPQRQTRAPVGTEPGTSNAPADPALAGAGSVGVAVRTEEGPPSVRRGA